MTEWRGGQGRKKETRKRRAPENQQQLTGASAAREHTFLRLSVVSMPISLGQKTSLTPKPEDKMCSCLLWTPDVKGIGSQCSQYDLAIIRPGRKNYTCILVYSNR